MESPFIELTFAKKICKADGDPLEDGDSILVHLNTQFQALDGFPTTSLVVVRIINDGHGVVYDRRVANQDFRAADIAAVHAQHDCSCPESCNFTATVTAPITSVEVAGVAIDLPNYPYAVSALGAAALQTDLRAWLQSNHPAGQVQPYVTVTYNDLATDTLVVSITGSTLDFTEVNATAFTNSCD